MFGKPKETIAKDGSTVFTKPKQFRKISKEIQKRQDPTINEKINSEIEYWKGQLSDSVKELKKHNAESFNPRKPQEKGFQYEARTAKKEDLYKKRDKAVKKLEDLGVIVVNSALKRGQIIYKSMYNEGGHDNMFTTNEIKTMKLDIFEENSKGLISDDLRDYMLITLESVMNEVERNEAFIEAVNEKIDSQRSKFVEFVSESYNAGLINSTQFEVLTEMAEDDFLFDVAMPNQIPNLVNAFIEAAKDGDEAKKAEVKEKIEEAKELKAIEDSGDSDEDVVTEGTNCSIVEKLESLKIKLSDEEKEMATRFDEMIQKAMDKEDEKDNNESGESKKDEEPANNETPEEEPVNEGVEPVVMDEFNSIVLESSINDDDSESLMNYMAEAVADNVYSEADMDRVRRMLEMR